MDARRAAARLAHQGEFLLWILNLMNVIAVMAVPSFTVRRTRAEPVPAFFLMLITIILWMKLISYWHCNLTLRCACWLGWLNFCCWAGQLRCLQLAGLHL